MGLKIDSKNEPVNGCDDAFLSPILEEVKAYMDEIGAQGRETSGVPLGYLWVTSRFPLGSKTSRMVDFPAE